MRYISAEVKNLQVRYIPAEVEDLFREKPEETEEKGVDIDWSELFINLGVVIGFR